MQSMAGEQTVRIFQDVRAADEARNRASDRLAFLLLATLSLAFLWVGGTAVEGLAVSGPAGLAQSGSIEGTFSAGTSADYARALEHTIAPVGGEVSRTIRQVVVSTRDFVPLPWGKAYA